MTREFSLYLDLVRFLAACLVVAFHSNVRDIISEPVPLSSYGHEAVVIFFVLSGYVIAYISDTKERTATEYWASRLARIYSLAIPAVFLTIALDLIGSSITPSFYDGRPHDYWYIRMLASLLFLNEMWFFSIMSFSNFPYWSLCYEMWYYIAYAAFFLCRGRTRAILLTSIALLVGPKILILAPLWILGVVIYRYRPLYGITEFAGWVMFLLSFGALYLYVSQNVSIELKTYLSSVLGKYYYEQLVFSKFFLSDYLLAAIIFLNFTGFRRIAHRFSSLLLLFKRPIRELAAYTFSIYIFHQPLILFYAALLDWSPAGWHFYCMTLALTVLTIFLLGWLLEKRRHAFRSWIFQTMLLISQTRYWRERVAPLDVAALRASGRLKTL